MAKSLYLNKVQMQAELSRCLGCKLKPCAKACPIGVSPADFIALAKAQKEPEAARHILARNPLAGICGLICPDKFCQKSCTRGNIDFPINIPKLQATLVANAAPDSLYEKLPAYNGRQIAVIGAGPAGMAATAALVGQGCKVTLFDSAERIGGALNLIPEDRLPQEVIRQDWSRIEANGRITLKLKTKVVDFKALLKQGFDSVIVATGAPVVTPLNIEGEALSLPFDDYLNAPEKYKASGRVAVIGGGNVAADCALTAKAQGALSVEMFVRRRISDMRISKAEYLDLLAHQVDICAKTSPEKISKDKDGLTLTVHQNTFKDDKWEAEPNTSLELKHYDLIIKAVGSRPIEYEEDSRIIFCGDCKNGTTTAVEAAASGQMAAMVALQNTFEERKAV